jgi:hypothetical protein
MHGVLKWFLPYHLPLKRPCLHWCIILLTMFSTSTSFCQRPADTAQNNRIDTFTPQPKADIISRVFETHHIFPTNSAYELVALLNPGLKYVENIKANYPLILPEFPSPPRALEKTNNVNFRAALKSDVVVNDAFIHTTNSFDSVAQLFRNSSVAIKDESGQEVYLRRLLSTLVKLCREAGNKLRITSRATVSQLNETTMLLNSLLINYANKDEMIDFGDKVYYLCRDMKIILYHILGKDRVGSMEGLSRQSHEVNDIVHLSPVYFTSSTKSVNNNQMFSGDSDPQRFNIYVFRTEEARRGNRAPEKERYKIEYGYLGKLSADEDNWETVEGNASTTACYFPPARVVFRIRDLFSNKTYMDQKDLFNAQVDNNKQWTLADLFNKTYQLIILIPE